MRDKDVCSMCGRDGPRATSTRTLTEEGWRLEVTKDVSDKPTVSWFCSACWEKKTGAAPIQGKRKR